MAFPKASRIAPIGGSVGSGPSTKSPVFPIRKAGVVVLELCQPRRLMDLIMTVACTTAGLSAFYGIAGMAESGVLDPDALTRFLAIACPMVTMVQFVAPALVVAEALMRMNAKDLPVQTICLQLACNVCGISYGVQISNAAVLITNMFGLGCQLLFLTAEHFIRMSNSRWLVFSMRLALIFNFFLVLLSSVTPLPMLGHAITVLNVVMYASPLSKVGGILRARSSAGLSASITAISVANNAAWSVYALMLEDNVVLLPSLLGYMLSSFQVLVILWCNHWLPFDLSFLVLLCRVAMPARSEEEDEEEKVTTKPSDGAASAEAAAAISAARFAGFEDEFGAEGLAPLPPAVVWASPLATSPEQSR